MHEYACLFRTLTQNYHTTISFDYSNHQAWPFCSDSKITTPSRRKSSERSQETLKGRERSLSCENKTILRFIQKLFEGAIKIWCLWNLFLWPNFSTFKCYWQSFTLCTPFSPWRQNSWCIALLVLLSACMFRKGRISEHQESPQLSREASKKGRILYPVPNLHVNTMRPAFPWL